MASIDSLRGRCAVRISKLNEAYNADFDLVRDGPDVTWADKKLLEIVEALEERVNKLEKQKQLEPDPALADLRRIYGGQQ